MNMSKRMLKRILWICCTAAGVILVCHVFLAYDSGLEVFPIEDSGRLRFTDQYDPEALLMIPAAYTGKDGEIEGEYRINGEVFGTPSRKERISLHPTRGIVISGSWHSGNGFQQTVLVKNGRPRMHEDARRRFRRALCNEDKTGCSLMIVESSVPMTLSDFAKDLSNICWSAVNLDMGDYGYGWYGDIRFSRWAYYNRGRQTNWLCIK